MNYRRSLAAILICLLLTGCTGVPSETTQAPSTTPAQTEPTVIPTTEPTVPPTTEPEPELEPGVTVVADGDSLESGSVLYEGVTYVRADEFLAALDDAHYTADDAGISFSWKDDAYQIIPDTGSIFRNEAPLILASTVITWRESIWIPVEEVCEILGVSLLDDPDYNTLYCTSAAGDYQWELGVNIPILMYHGVTDNTWGSEELFVSPSDMEAQIQYLVKNGYDTITFEDWDHLEDFDKPVMLTFDDGYMDNYEELFPILQKYNAKATIFVITVSVDRDERTMTSDQARDMAMSGLVSIQSHTYNHPYLSECGEDALNKQMRWSKYAITRMTGYEPFVICYPYGDSSPLAREIAAEYYSFGLNMNGGLYTTEVEVFQIPRYYVSRYTTLSEFIAMVEDAGR